MDKWYWKQEKNNQKMKWSLLLSCCGIKMELKEAPVLLEAWLQLSSQNPCLHPSLSLCFLLSIHLLLIIWEWSMQTSNSWSYMYVCLPPSLRMVLQLLPLLFSFSFSSGSVSRGFWRCGWLWFDSMGPSFGGVGYSIKCIRGGGGGRACKLTWQPAEKFYAGCIGLNDDYLNHDMTQIFQRQEIFFVPCIMENLTLNFAQIRIMEDFEIYITNGWSWMLNQMAAMLEEVHKKSCVFGQGQKFISIHQPFFCFFLGLFSTYFLVPWWNSFCLVKGWGRKERQSFSASISVTFVALQNLELNGRKAGSTAFFF